MESANKCTKCGNEKFEPGKIQSTGKIYFKPKHTKFWTFKTSEVAVIANLCLNCGFIELTGDLEKIEKIAK